MTEEEYYAIIKRLGLRPTRFKETFVTLRNEPYNVPLASKQAPKQREETIERLKLHLGITWRD